MCIEVLDPEPGQTSRRECSSSSWRFWHVPRWEGVWVGKEGGGVRRRVEVTIWGRSDQLKKLTAVWGKRDEMQKDWAQVAKELGTKPPPGVWRWKFRAGKWVRMVLLKFLRPWERTTEKQLGTRTSQSLTSAPNQGKRVGNSSDWCLESDLEITDSLQCQWVGMRDGSAIFGWGSRRVNRLQRAQSDLWVCQVRPKTNKRITAYCCFVSVFPEVLWLQHSQW